MIREITPTEFGGLWPIFEVVVRGGDAYAYPPDITEAEACALWLTPPSRCFVLEQEGEVVGGYMLRPNQPGLGSHVANAGYLVAPKWRGRGFASHLCEHSMEVARAAGFIAMQFNFVVSTNVIAVKLWQKHGFAVIGTIPNGFRHVTFGPVDVLIMYRSL